MYSCENNHRILCALWSITYICIEFWYIMAEDDRKLLIGFEGRLRHFIYLYGELKKENLSLRQLLSEKEAEIDRLNNRIKELEDMYANLKSARIISINDNELKDTRQRLMKLVREVDKCIALLNE